MKIKFLMVLLALECGVSWAYSPPGGIPNPADSMGFDPLNIERPDPTVKCPGWPEVSSRANGNPCDCYYIDKDDPNASDVGNTYGYPNKPRVTIPISNVNIVPNSYVEIHGASTPYTETFRVRTNKGSVDSITWFVGKNGAVINNQLDIGYRSDMDSMKYLIFDSLTFNYTSGAAIRPRYANHHKSKCWLDISNTSSGPWNPIDSIQGEAGTVDTLQGVAGKYHRGRCVTIP